MKRLMPLIALTAACNNFLTVPPPPPPAPGTPVLHSVGTFASPLYVGAAADDSSRIYVVEQGGVVRVVRNDTTLATPFLDLSAAVSSGGERGLLSIAFHPQFATNHHVYVYFTDAGGDIRVVRYDAVTRDSADAATADTVLKVAHPVNANHNGGQLQFGPDGMLWIGTGDGGGTGDPDTNAQNKHRLLGKLLRIDVNVASGYAIPTDNPAASDTSFAPEVWAYGLRNPWRFSFDPQGGDLYIADVGENSWEEVDIASAFTGRGKGANYGWNIMEGQSCYPPGDSTCVQTGLTLPPVVFSHGFGACAITGGYVYRGAKIPVMTGHYFFADYCTGFVRSVQISTSTTQVDWTSLLSPGASISSFGRDASGELYVMSLNGGVFRIVPAP